MTRREDDVVITEKTESLDDIHAAIGQVAALMLQAGRPLELAALSAQLKQHAAQSADARLKKEYEGAARFVAEKM
ncbi:hypothetical protein B2J69_11715 [Pantoea latae]|jgi:hypothetical protein|uniref:Uncharacterized protein n=1 Tax=Pantoea latae TaxID=1964541 RepID=A0A1V9DHL3_9GAMM|nr:hypothetical protein B2J69_11715 [Pantoea latae]